MTSKKVVRIIAIAAIALMVVSTVVGAVLQVM